MEDTLHFRLNVPGLITETLSSALKGPQPEIKIAFKHLVNFLGQVGQRCAEINDPVLNRLMFDMNLYDLPLPGTVEYENIMYYVYEKEKEFLKNKQP